MAHHQAIGIYLFAAECIDQIACTLQIEILLLCTQQVEQRQRRLAGTRALQPHVDGSQLELLQAGDIAIGSHHYGEGFCMGGKQGPQLGLRLADIGTQPLAGLIEPVRLHQSVACLASLQLAKVLDGT